VQVANEEVFKNYDKNKIKIIQADGRKIPYPDK
jgi:hypothetical protein